MQQLELFEPTYNDLLNEINTLKKDMELLRKGLFYRFDELKKDYRFLQDELETTVMKQIAHLGE